MTRSQLLSADGKKSNPYFLQQMLTCGDQKWFQPRYEAPLKRTKVVEYEIALPKDLNPFQVFDSRQNTWKVLWKSKDSQEVRVGIGTCVFLSQEELESLTVGCRFYGGLPFYGHQGEFFGWSEFALGRFFLPETEWVLGTDKPRILVRCLVEKKWCHIDMVEKVKKILSGFHITDIFLNQPLNGMTSTDVPPFPVWCHLVEMIKEKIHRQEAEKIVLSRCRQIEMNGLHLPTLLSRLSENDEHSFQFAFETPSGSAFLGRSPERLMSWKQGQVSVDAMAGTRRRGHSLASDQKAAEELKNSSKDIGEHRAVSRFLEAELAEFCSEVKKVDAERIYRLKNVQHLVSRYRATVKSGVSPFDVMNRLHPTPAVGGVPRKVAVDFLRQFEPYYRGWFAGPVGWTNGQEGDFAIGIRSARWTGTALHVFGGAGIVAGSDPLEEWNEAELKMKNFFDLIDLR